MAPGRAVLIMTTLPWLMLLLSLPSATVADEPPFITISPTDPPPSAEVDVRLYKYFTSGVIITLVRSEVVGNVLEIEHDFHITNLPDITEFDETHHFGPLAGDYTVRWIRHLEYAGEVSDSVLELPFTAPLSEPVTLTAEGVPALDPWALATAAVMLALTWSFHARRRGGPSRQKT